MQLKCWRNILIAILVFSIFLPNTSICQNNGEILMAKGDSLIGARDYGNAILIYDNAWNYFIEKKEWKSALKALGEKSYCLNASKEYGKTIASIEEKKATILKEGLQHEFLFGKILMYKGYAYRWLENFGLSLKTFEEAISLYEKGGHNHRNMAYAYRFAGQIYMRRLEYEKAINYFEKALKSDSTSTYDASIYGLLATTNSFTENYDEVLKYCQKGLASNSKDPIYLNGLLTASADALAATGKYSEAEKKYHKAHALIEKLEHTGHAANRMRNRMALGQLYAKTGKQDEAILFFNKAIEEAQNGIEHKNREVAKSYADIGLFFSESGDIEKALYHYQKAIIQLFPNFNNDNFSQNPKTSDLYTESWIMTSFARKGDAMIKRYKLKNDISDLITAEECFDLTILGVQNLKDTYGSERAKLYLSDYSHNYFEEAIEVNYLLHEKTGESKYIEKAFSIMEQSKASVLEEGIRKNRGLILAGLPDSILSQEEDLRLNITDLDNRIKSEELKEADSDDEYISKLRSRYVDQQREYESLLNHMKEAFPQFRNFTENPTPPNINDLQIKLKEKGASLIEYFEGTNNYYSILASPDGIFFTKSERTETADDLINEFLRYFDNSNAIINDMIGFSKNAHQLFSFLFPEKIYNKVPHHLVIIPSGKLNYVPFDALMPKEKSGEPFSIKDFLINSHLLNFHYSAGLWLKSKNTFSSNETFLSIAPEFANAERGLTPLMSGNMNFSMFPKSKKLKGHDASLSNFRSLSGKSRFIHFSTHAGASANDAKIEFIDTSLFISDLYTMKIPAELVTLSACETGLGKYEKGEGVMSLARGFAYAGTTNLIASLWQVNEKSTADIFDLFYKNIAEGKGKADALRTARMQYMENAVSDIKKSPYFWAGFTLIGDNEPVEIKNEISFWFWGVLIGSVVFLIFFLNNRKKNSS